MLQTLFFELVQVSLGTREKLSQTPTDEEWLALYDTAKKQSLLGITYQGIKILSTTDQRPSKKILFKWYPISQKLDERNTLFDQKCFEVQKLFSEAGIHSSILKGQGLAMNYGILRKLRQPGDIDVFVDCGRDKAIEFAKELGQDHILWNYKHLELKMWQKITVEVHYHVEMFFNPFKNKKLQHWFKENEELLYHPQEELVVPTSSMNVFYVLLHLYNHFLSSGVGLRQFIDYYFLLRNTDLATVSYHNGASLEDVLKAFGLWRFAGGVMWVLQEVIGLEPSHMYCEPKGKEGRLILNEVMASGSFGPTNIPANQRFKRATFLINACKRSWRIFRLCPSDAIWSPLWFVGHKCWMIMMKTKKSY